MPHRLSAFAALSFSSLAAVAQTQIWSAPAPGGAPPQVQGPSVGAAPGQTILALSSGSWHRATILEAGPQGYKVRYDGWGAGWDEWLPPARLRMPDGTPLAAPAAAARPVGPLQRAAPELQQAPAAAARTVPGPRPAEPPAQGGGYRAGEQVWVYWTGTSHKARILEARGGEYLVRYEGYDSKWDEWVAPARIGGRVEGAAAQTAAAAGGAAQPAAGGGGVLGRWECVTWDAGQLNRIGGFTLAAGGNYTDLHSGQAGRYTFQASTGRIAFTSGPQKIDAKITFDPQGRQGRGHIVFDYGGGARLDCYRAR